MTRYLAVMAGGAAGSLARYVLGVAMTSRYPGRFPLATCVINVTGSFLIGLVLTLLPERSAIILRPLIVTGFLGGYTTFSAFEWETYASPRGIALLYVTLSVLGGLAACWGGVRLARYVGH